MKNHYHFIGIGGIGMGALGSLLLAKGFRVSGSDIRENAMTKKLRNQGATIAIGHEAGNIEGADCVVFSSAIDENNPELIAAKEKKLIVIQRGQLLADLMKDHIGITVAGAHGKTTTTSMISHMFIEAGLQPTTAIGGIVNGEHSNASLGTGTYFIAEADESDASFLYFEPQYSVITNIDCEHLDHYKNWDHILETFQQYIGRTKKDGMIIACGDDERLRHLLRQSWSHYKIYGFGLGNDVIAENITMNGFNTEFDCIISGRRLGRVQLKIPGKHNVANALACICLGVHLKIDFDVIRESLKNYRGIQRRFQLKGTVNDIMIIDDYAHHPTEIKATLNAARTLKKENLITIFQPHRYSRLKHLLPEFAESLILSDYIIVMDIYAASERPIEGVSVEKLMDQIRRLTKHPVVHLKKDQIADHVLTHVKSGDMVMTLGAGDITTIANDLFLRLKENQRNQKMPLPHGAEI